MNNLNKIVAVLLLLAVLPLPYFYYQLLRIVVTLAAAANAYIFFEDKQMARVLAFGIIALIWNPIFPFYMDKSVWMISDIIGAGVFFFGGSDD